MTRRAHRGREIWYSIRCRPLSRFSDRSHRQEGRHVSLEAAHGQAQVADRAGRRAHSRREGQGSLYRLRPQPQGAARVHDAAAEDLWQGADDTHVGDGAEGGAPVTAVAASAPDAKSRLQWLPLAAALVSVVLWAAAFVGIRAAGRACAPGALALGRLTLGSVLLGTLLLTRPRTRPSGREAGLLLLAGLMWFGVYNLALNQGERSMDAGTAAMLVLIAPIFIVALAAVFLKERVSPALLVGGSVAFGGVVVIGLATSAGGAATTAYLVPPIAIVMSWLILGEIPGMLAVLGGALCLVGVYIARRPAKGSV